MKKTSKKPALLGAILLLLMAVVLIYVARPMPEFDDYGNEIPIQLEDMVRGKTLDSAIVKYVIALVAASVLGFLGAALIGRRNKLAGTLMVLGGAIAFMTMFGIFSCVLLVVSGTRVIKEEREKLGDKV